MKCSPYPIFESEFLPISAQSQNRKKSKEVIEYRVSGRDFLVVDIPPGYTHSIENVGNSDMVVLFWVSEVFDPDHSDTYYEEV